MGAPLRKVWVAVAAASLLASACSSVTRLSSGQTTRAGSNSRAGATGGGSGANGNAAAGAAGGAAGTGTGATGGATATGAGGGSVTGGTDALGAVSGGGATCARPVRIGASFSSDLATGLAIVGHPDAAATYANYTATVKQSYQLAADDLNQRGGIHGCPVELAFHDFKSLGADGFDGESQQECTDFVQDQKVDVVYTNALENQVLVECLAQAGVPVNIGYFSPDKPDFDRYSSILLGQDAMAVSRFGPFIGAWAQAGYFADQGTKVGILAGDDGSGSRFHLVDDIWVPELKAMGYDPEVFKYRSINGYNDVSRVTSLFSQAVLQFKGTGVNHVIIPPDQSNGVIFFTQVADSQGYHPRYAVTSESGAASWYSVTSSQRARAVALSYRINDVVLDQDLVDQNDPTPTRTRCIQLYQPQNILVDYRWCDFLQFLQDALANSDFSVAALQQGIESLDTAHASGQGYGTTRFGPGAHDGLAHIRAMLWDDNANQWAYTSGLIDIP